MVDKTRKKLTGLQKLFVEEYLIDLNAKQACIRSGYSKETAASSGWKNVNNPIVIKAIQDGMNNRVKKIQRTAQDVLNGIFAVHADATQLITNKSGHTSMLDRTAALKALELEGKHRKMFTDKIELTGQDGGAIDHNMTVSFISAKK